MNKPTPFSGGLHYQSSAAPSVVLTPEQRALAQAALTRLQATPEHDWCELFFLRRAAAGEALYREQVPLLNQLLAKWGGAK